MLGDRFVDRRRLAEILQSQGNLNTGDTFGGLAHVLQQYLVGRETGRERQEQQAAMDAFTQGASAKPWVNPDTGETMGQAGGLLGAQYALSQLQGNPTAARLSSQLMMQQLDRDEERRQWEDRFNTQNQAQMDRFRMEQEAADRRFQQQLAVQREIAQMRMAAPSEAPSTVREWEYFNSLSPEDQQRFLAMKRAQQNLNLGDRFVTTDQLNPGGVIGEYGVGLSPERKIQDGRVITMPGVPGGQLQQGPGTPAVQGGQMPGYMPGGYPDQTAQAPGVMVQELPQTRAEREQAALRQSLEETNIGATSDSIMRALDMVQNSRIPMTGIAGWASSTVPGTPAHDLSEMLDGIKASIGFERLQQMREASPTGSALGNVTEFENRLLQRVYGSLEQSLSRAQLEENLKRVYNVLNDIVHGPGNGPQRFHITTPDVPRGGAQQPTQQAPQMPAQGGWSIQRVD